MYCPQCGYEIDKDPQLRVAGLEPTEWVTHTQWDGYARRIERDNLRAGRPTFTFVSIARHANHLVLEVRDKTMLVQKGWRAVMRQARPEKETSL